MIVEQMIAAVAAGGALGASDQYLCLLLLGVAANYGLVFLPPEVAFMKSIWFLGVVGVFWIILVLQAYATFLAPIVMNVVNLISHALSGVFVPASGVLLGIATANMVQAFAPNAAHAITPDLILVGGAGAAAASAVTFLKFVLKPMGAVVTGTAGHVSAPIYKTLENVAAIVLLGIIYELIQIDPWLLAVFVFLLALALLAITLIVLYKLWETGQGIGQVMRLIESNPRAGLAVLIEPFVWGGGWALYRGWKAARGKLAVWAVALFVLWFAVPAVFFFVPPIALIILIMGSLAGIYLYGLRSARQLLKTIRADSWAAAHHRAPRATALMAA